jgi:hypothetical protein
MVDYHDQAVVMQGNGAYVFAAQHASLWSQLNWLSLTVAASKLWHAVAGLYLFVCPTARTLYSHNNNLALHFQLGACHYSRL